MVQVNVDDMKPLKDRTGQKIGSLTAIRYLYTRTIGKNTKRAMWEFLCDCGRTFITQGNIFTNPKGARSCGCINTLTGKNNNNFKGYETITGSYIASIKNRVKNRKTLIDFDIDAKFIYELLVTQNFKCKLSGLPILRSGVTNKVPYKIEDTASLDRIDSNKGYTKDNVQWLHKDINQMKMDLPQDKFIEYCKLITQNQI